MPQTISNDTTVVVAKDQISCDLTGEVVLLNLNAGMYYGLDGVGARVWNLIQEPRRVEEVRDVILQEYDVEPSRCETDLLDLLQTLDSKGLIEVQGCCA